MVITVMKSIQLYPVIHVSFKNRETQHKQENVAARTDFALDYLLFISNLHVIIKINIGIFSF